MNITDPVADLLTRIRNASAAKHSTVDIPSSNLKEAIAKILLVEGYITGYKVLEDDKQNTLHVTLKYTKDKTGVITGLRRVSKPGLRIYSGHSELPRVMRGLGTAIISTPQGVMTDKKARQAKVGGEVLAFVW